LNARADFITLQATAHRVSTTTSDATHQCASQSHAIRQHGADVDPVRLFVEKRFGYLCSP
jgi:hypothetical protein